MLVFNRLACAHVVVFSALLVTPVAYAEKSPSDAGVVQPVTTTSVKGLKQKASIGAQKPPITSNSDEKTNSNSLNSKKDVRPKTKTPVSSFVPNKNSINPAVVQKISATVGRPAIPQKSAQKAPQVKKSRRAKYKAKKKRKLKRRKVRRARSAKRKGKKRTVRQRWPTKRPKVTLDLPPIGPAPYSTGERLFFKLEMFGTAAGEVALVVGKTSTVGGREAQELVGFIRGSEFLNKFYPVNNRLDALVDSKTMLPLRSNFFIREKGGKSDYHTVFDHKKRLIRSIRLKKEKKLYRNFSQFTNIYESLGSIYGVRRMDLKVGMTFNYYIWDSRKERLISVAVVGEERVQTDAGWFDTLRLDVSAQITGGFMRNKMLKAPIRRGSLWLAKDRYRTPVKVLTPTKLGDATATLIRRVHDENETQ